MANTLGYSVRSLLQYVLSAPLCSESSLDVYYAVLTLRAFTRRRRVLKSLMESNTSFTYDRYLRLIAICIIQISTVVPLCTYFIIHNLTTTPIYEWRGFADLHYHFNRIEQYPMALWTLNPTVQGDFETNEWTTIACALVYFAVFGFTSDARKRYVSALNAIRYRLGIRPSSVCDAENPRRYVTWWLHRSLFVTSHLLYKVGQAHLL